MPKSKKLPFAQSRFCEEFLKDLNATQAAIRSGYSQKTARTIACKLLAKAHIQAKIQSGMEKRSKRLEISADKTLTEIAKLAFSNMMDYLSIQPDGQAFVDLSKLERDQAAAIQEYTVDEYYEHDPDSEEKNGMRKIKKIKVKLADKRAALELLARHLKLLNDKLDVNVVHTYLHEDLKDLDDTRLREEGFKIRDGLSKHLTPCSQN